MNFFQRILLMKLVFIMVFFFNTSVNANNSFRVYFNFQEVDFDVAPFIDENNKIQMPVRAIFEMFSAKIYWNDSEKSIKILVNNDVIVIPVGKTTAFINGIEFSMDSKSLIVDGRSFVPMSLLNFLSESLEKKVSWVESDRAVYIFYEEYKNNSTSKAIDKIVVDNKSINQEIVEILTFDAFHNQLGYGNGVIISEDGKIVTNYDVIKNANSIKIIFNKRDIYKVTTIHSFDKNKNLAILQTENFSNKPYSTLGDSSKININEEIHSNAICIGSRFEKSNGVISKIKVLNKLNEIDYFESTIELDKIVNGSGVYSSKNEMIGIYATNTQNSKKIIIPSNIIKNLMLNDSKKIPMKEFSIEHFEMTEKTFYYYESGENTSFKNADVLLLSKLIIGRLENNTNEKYYKVNINNEGHLNLYLEFIEEIDGGLIEKLNLSLYDKDFNIIASSIKIANEGLGSKHLHAKVKSGEYYIKLEITKETNIEMLTDRMYILQYSNN